MNWPSFVAGFGSCALGMGIAFLAISACRAPRGAYREPIPKEPPPRPTWICKRTVRNFNPRRRC
jgi:hypothetical protein